MTQDALAQRLGLTFQKVQKYEKGTNSISGNRLYQLVNIFNLNV
jgi:transcriptional regulator with XRE-family HTH domain